MGKLCRTSEMRSNLHLVCNERSESGKAKVDLFLHSRRKHSMRFSLMVLGYLITKSFRHADRMKSLVTF